MTYQEIRVFLKKMNAGKVSIEELKATFLKAVESKKQIKEEISKTYKVVDLKRKFYYSRSNKKSDLVDDYFEQVLGSFRVSEGLVSYSFTESYEKALSKIVEKQTQKDLDEYVQRRKEKQAAFDKSLENPETIKEFEEFILYKGSGALSSKQKTLYEQLIADRTLEEQKKKAAYKSTVKAVDVEVELNIQKTVHTKKGYDIWVVQLSDRVEKSKYNELSIKAKQLGGYYSSYAKDGAIPGFQFKTEEAAKQFVSLKDGDVSRADKLEEKASNKQLTVSERFKEMAANWEAQAREKLTAERNTNTARRARMAAGVEADAESKIYAAKVLREIATGLEKQEIKYLGKIDSAAQLDTLRTIIYTAYYARMRAQNIPWDKWESDFEKDIDYVVYPYPSYHWERLRSLSYKLEQIKGQKLRARRIYQSAIAVNTKKGKWQAVMKGSDILSIRMAAEVLKDKADRDWLKNGLEKYDRLQRMGLTNLAILKTALREYDKYSKVSILSPEEEKEKLIKQLERKFVGKKIPGFFPTPRPLVIRMLSLADIDTNDKILEPSAGLGHIADIITEKYPENELLVIEDYKELADALEKKGYEVVKDDFLSYKGGKFDKIIMNPPFENLQDIDHVRHAYAQLKPGGRLVAIMAGNKGDGSSRKKVQEFREWLDNIGAYVEENPEGSFKSAFRSTGVRTITVAIDKVAGQEEPPKTVETEPTKLQDTGVKLEPWQMRLKDYVAMRNGSSFVLGEKYFKDFVDNVSHWGGAWPVDRRTGGTWSVDRNVTLRYIKDHRQSVLDALKEGKPVSKEVLKDQMLEENPIIRIKLSEIHVDEKRFQNRSKLNQKIVDEIAKNFDDDQFDPLVIWRDNKDNKVYLLAGYHRLAGAKKASRYLIAARWFIGSEKQAITYAKELSNANRTLETPIQKIEKEVVREDAPATQKNTAWNTRLKDYVYLRAGDYKLAHKFFEDFQKNVTHWGGAWPVDKRTNGTWNADPVTLKYIKMHRQSVLDAIKNEKDVPAEVLKDHMLDTKYVLNPIAKIYQGRYPKTIYYLAILNQFYLIGEHKNEKVVIDATKKIIGDRYRDKNLTLYGFTAIDAPETLPLDVVNVDTKRFQNRKELNKAIVKEIAEKYDENQFDPIVVWIENGKIYLLAGHHRLAGTKLAGRTEIKVRWFIGSEAEAITYAKELSNANRTLETPMERANLYRQKITNGEDPKKVRTQAEKLEGKNWRYILNLAYLNPDGKPINALIALVDNSDKNTQQNLEKIADWCGEARRQFAPLTNTHENEMYDFLLDNFKASKPSISRKDVFIERVRAIVQALDFNNQPLNLKRIQYKTQGESEYESQMKVIDEQIRVAEDKKKELNDRFNKPSHPKYVSPGLTDYDKLQKQADKQVEKLNEELKALRKKKLDLTQKKGTMVKGGLAQMDLFVATTQKIEKEVDEIRLRQNKPEKNQETESNLADTYEQAFTEKDYIEIVRAKLDRARLDSVKVTEAEIIQLGIMIRPLVQSYTGALIDVISTNKRVLAPTLNNLLRWAQKPGRYDLVGVDIANGAKPNVVARKIQRARILNLLGLK